jgi:hypothetical protein
MDKLIHLIKRQNTLQMFEHLFVCVALLLTLKKLIQNFKNQTSTLILIDIFHKSDNRFFVTFFDVFSVDFILVKTV